MATKMVAAWSARLLLFALIKEDCPLLAKPELQVIRKLILHVLYRNRVKDKPLTDSD